MLSLHYQPHLARSRPLSARAGKVEALLNRYPDLSEQELAALIESFPYLPPLDVSLMLADKRLAAKLEGFHRDHQRMLYAPRTMLLAALIATGLFAAIILWSVLHSVPAF